MTNTDWDVIDKLVSLLEVYYQLTVRMSDRYANASIIIPEILLVKMSLSDKDTRAYLKNLGKTLTKLNEEMADRYQVYLDNPNLMMATFMDPRYKHWLFKDEPADSNMSLSTVEKHVTESYFKHEHEKKQYDEMKKKQEEEEKAKAVTPPPTNSSQTETSESSTSTDIVMDDVSGENTKPGPSGSKSKTKSMPMGLQSIFARSTARLFAAVKEEEEDSKAISPDEKDKRVMLAHEIQKYKEITRLEMNKDPFDWWKCNAVMFPLLSFLAARMLSSPPSSVESERTFSIGGNVVTKDRTRLTAGHTEQLIFLNSSLPNLPMQDYCKYY